MPRTWKGRIGCGVFVLLLAIVALFVFLVAVPFWGWGTGLPTSGTVPLTPPWVLECWVWEDDHNTAEFVNELLAGYREHDIPARTILIDSPWTTRYNDFIVDEKLYPEPEKFFTGLQDQGYRVVLWMTNNVNSISKDTAIQDSADWFQEVANKGYLGGGDYQWRWWKGTGGFIDYTNPDAMKWWREQQQKLFDWGLDGWKLDGTATFFTGKWGPLILPYQTTHSGLMTTRQYMDHYYTDEYEHGLTQNPEFVCLSRAVDDGVPYMHPRGFAPLRASAVNWVGDQDHAWAVEDEGIQEALRDVLKSARMGYNIVGCDVGGYSGGEIPPNVYIRWAQWNAYCGLFLNGGHGERRLWLRTPDELELIRRAAWLHTELIPYIYSYMVVGHEGGPVLMRPDDIDYQYYFGDDLFISPIFEDSTKHTVTLPEGRWRWWDNDTEVIEGPTTITRDFTISQFPAYIRDGAILPMQISRAYTGIGDRDWEKYLTLNLYPHGDSAMTIHHPDKSGTTDVKVATGDTIGISLSGVKKPHILRVLLDKAPTQVTLDGAALPAEAWQYNAEKQRLIVKTDTYTNGQYNISF